MVCEGPSDRAIIEAILDYYLGDFEPRAIQPPMTAACGDSGPFGGGWKGIQAWCKQEAMASSGLDSILDNSDLLIIQVDSDVAADDEIGLAKPCPPPNDSANEIRVLILKWLGVSQVPDKVILCTPSMASETWALVAIFPHDASVVGCHPPPADGECIECRTDIKMRLKTSGKKLSIKLVSGQTGKLKNQARGYRVQQKKITKAWPNVVKVCSEAARFDVELCEILPSSTV